MVRPRIVIDPAVFHAIKPGMTPTEVEALIGGAPGDYTGGAFGVLRFT